MEITHTTVHAVPPPNQVASISGPLTQRVIIPLIVLQYEIYVGRISLEPLAPVFMQHRWGATCLTDRN